MQFREKARPTLALCLALAGTVAPLAGCQNRPGMPQVQAPAAIRTAPPVSPDPTELAALLEQAEAAMERDQLIYPASGSALNYFDRVLAMDPDNQQAQRGLERIVERYLQWAVAAAERNRPAAAQSMLDRARIVDPNSPSLAPVQTQIRLLATAKRHRLRLNRNQLRSRSAALRDPLKDFGSRAREGDCRATIRVPSDAEGRWVYQQMSLAPGDARIRADIEIGTPPQVELMCFKKGS